MSELFGAQMPPGSPLATPTRTVDAIVLAAMDAELAPYERRADVLSHRQRAGAARSVLATIAGRSLLLVRTGIGAVNAVSAATLAVHAVRSPFAVSSGSAGGLADGVRIGDVVVGNDHAFTDSDATAFGYAMGQVPGMPVSYAGEPVLVERAQRRSGVLVGQMLSGNSFVDARTVDQVRERFPLALTTDMETAALAQTCFNYNVPFLAVRGVSDLCGPKAGVDFGIAVDDAATLAADVVLELLDVPVAASA